MNRQLLIIDPQNDFCDVSGTLPVKGANVDMFNLAQMVDRIGYTLDRIHVTLDNHRNMHIAHPAFWVNDKGENPTPLTTLISADDVKSGKWMTTIPAFQKAALDYVEALAEKGRFPLVIWPVHCVVNTWGSNVYPVLSEALTRWENACMPNMMNYLPKGQNSFTEMYGAFEAEVVVSFETSMNIARIEDVYAANQILIAGEALSHCVAESVRQMAKHIDPSKMILLSDCTSNVGTYEFLGDAFVKELTEKGMKVCKSTEVM